MKTRSILFSVLLSTSLLGAVGCAKNPADGVPKAAVQTPATTASTPADPMTGASPTDVAMSTETPAPVTGEVYTFPEGAEVAFRGSKVTGEHDGKFEKVTGNVTVPAADLAQAVIDLEIDMASTVADDEKLTGHLKSPDFFDVASHPTSRFKSTQVAKKDDGYEVTGDLTLHGVTKTISFPAVISLDGDTLSTKSEFYINRKDFNIVYPGKPDDLIRDEVVIKFDLKANKGA